MNVISENLQLRHLASVLLQVTHELPRSDFPYTDFSLHTSRADKLGVVGKADGSDSVFVGVVDLPEHLTVVHSIGSDLSIGPT